MGIVVSLILIAIGAILRFAVTVNADGFNLHTAGIILMIVGGIGLILSMIFWAPWVGRRTAIVESRVRPESDYPPTQTMP